MNVVYSVASLKKNATGSNKSKMASRVNSIRDRSSDLYVGIDMVKNYCLLVTKYYSKIFQM